MPQKAPGSLFSDLQMLAGAQPQQLANQIEAAAEFHDRGMIYPAPDKDPVRLLQSMRETSLFVCISPQESGDKKDYAVIQWEYGQSTMDAFELRHIDIPGKEWLFCNYTKAMLAQDDKARKRLRAPIVMMIDD